MPEHILRVSSLLKPFPDAKFLYIYRSPIEVALSIENSFGGSSFNWYGYESIKWHSLLSLLKEYPELNMSGEELMKVSDLFTRGLVEWILC